MKTLLFVLASLLHSSQGCLKMDIVLLGDLSGSCQGYEKFIGDGFISVIEKLDIGEENIKVSIVVFNSRANVLCPLTSDKKLLLQNAISVKSLNANYSTDISLALKEATRQLYSENARNVRKMIVLISDGQEDYPSGCKTEAYKVRNMGILLSGVVIDNAVPNEDFMKEICSYCIKSDYEQLSENIKQLDTCF